jgi:hypothetical protein
MRASLAARTRLCWPTALAMSLLPAQSVIVFEF